MNNLLNDIVYTIKQFADYILLSFTAHNAKTETNELNSNLKTNLNKHY